MNQRNYSEHKINENLDAEIFQVCLDEAKESYDSSIIKVLKSDSISDIEDNVEIISNWISNWNPGMTPAPSHSNPDLF